jgi:hypothetical protein
MPRYLLIPNRESAPTDPPGIVPLMGRTQPPPPEWAPPELSPFPTADGGRDPSTSFPDPFYRKEAMASAIRRGSGEYLVLWRTAVRALAGGLLRLEPVDLSRRGAFGRSLSRLRPERRFICLLYGKVHDTERLFALTDPDTLLWPAARRSAADWAAIERQVDSLPPDQDPIRLLADWRAALRQARSWEPSMAPWQRAMDLLLESAPGSPDLGWYREHARGEGPVGLSLPEDGRLRAAPCWFPVASPDWGRLVRRLATCSFGPDARGRLVARDRNGAEQLRLHLPVGLEGVERSHAGPGRLERCSGHPPAWGEAVSLAASDGLFRSAGAAVYPNRGLSVADIQRRPYLYCDPVRVLVGALGPAGLPPASLAEGAPASYGRSALQQALSRGLRLPEPAQVQERPGSGFVFVHDSGTALVYLEGEVSWPILELSRLGQVLWHAFQRELRAEGGPRPRLIFARSGEEVLALAPDGRMEVATAELDPLDEALRSRLSPRQASLQRFARAWSLADRAPTGGSSLDRLLAAGAWAFVHHLTGRAPHANGPLSGEVLRWPIGGDGLSLPLDIVTRVSP